MQQVVYGDVLLVINFCMDYLALYITSYLLRIKYRGANVFISALIGSLYSLVCIILDIDSLLFAVLSAAVMCVIAFLGNSKKYVLYEIIVFCAVNFLLGGGMTAVFNIFNSLGNSKDLLIYGELNTVESNLPMSVFFIGFIVIGAISWWFGKIMTKEARNEKALIYLTVNDKTAPFFVREDSGNLLTEPISGAPVIFLTESSLQKVLTREELNAINNIELHKISDKNIKTRLVVYETVGGKELCVCFKPQKIKTKEKESDAWIAVGKNMSFGDCEGIVPSAVLK